MPDMKAIEAWKMLYDGKQISLATYKNLINAEMGYTSNPTWLKEDEKSTTKWYISNIQEQSLLVEQAILNHLPRVFINSRMLNLILRIQNYYDWRDKQ